ncbi:MAG: hypothetical protein H7Z16_13890 [Pyrinomonadaceae bacterium]|nr:hypothetical protein [Pyrinomonadaceae bacterium]
MSLATRLILLITAMVFMPAMIMNLAHAQDHVYWGETRFGGQTWTAWRSITTHSTGARIARLSSARLECLIH